MSVVWRVFLFAFGHTVSAAKRKARALGKGVAAGGNREREVEAAG
jgi:hypothetical protein